MFRLLSCKAEFLEDITSMLSVFWCTASRFCLACTKLYWHRYQWMTHIWRGSEGAIFLGLWIVPDVFNLLYDRVPNVMFCENGLPLCPRLRSESFVNNLG